MITDKVEIVEDKGTFNLILHILAKYWSKKGTTTHSNGLDTTYAALRGEI